MKRKILYALALLLFLSTVAFSKERSRFHCRTSGTPCVTARDDDAASEAASEAAANGSENHVLLHTFIKLLYI